MLTNNLNGKTAFVTGGSRGIGRAVALELARQGANVAINYRSDQTSAQSCKEEIEALGRTAHIVAGDVSDFAAVDAMMRDAEQNLGPIDILVTSAGIADYEHHSEMTPETWRRTMATNVDGTAWAILAVKDGMLERGSGSIVCVGSIAGLRPRENMISYSASKAALVGMVRSFAAAFAPRIRVNCVAPGPTETDMINALPGMIGPERLKGLPLGRLATPEEVAKIVVLLVSENALLLNGQTLSVSGGEVMVP